MNWVNLDDVLDQLRSMGLQIDGSKLQFDARIQRWFVEDDKREKRGWSRLREWTSKSGYTYIVGAYGVWHGNDDGYTKVAMPADQDNRPKLTDEDKRAIREAQKESARKVAEERKREAKQAADWAASVWSKCEPSEDDEYLQRKRIKAHGTRTLTSTQEILLNGLDDSNFYRLTQAIGARVIPMHDELGNVCGIQFIYPKGHPRREKIERDKEFWPSGMAMGGTFGVIGPIRRTGVMLVAEGFATAASLHEATGQSVAYAFSANNLAKVGKLLRKKNPKLRLLFCADDDYLTAENPGVTACTQATAEIELSAWVKPDFMQDGNDLRGGKKLTDFNDLAILTGLPLILANQINEKLDSLEWRDAAPLQSQPPQQGGGDGDRRPAVSVMGLDDAVARFVPLDDGTGKYLFDQWRRDIVDEKQMITLLPAGMRKDNVKIHPVWVQRGAYYLDEVGFDPSETDRNVKLNTWCGWALQPKAGECGAILEQISFLCSLEPNAREIMHYWLCWMAYPLQNPGAKMSSAVILHGPQGTGKSSISEVLAKIYGRGYSNPQKDYSVWLDQKALQDNFNGDWKNKLFVSVEEAVNGSDKWQLKNELKALVTSETIRIRQVFRDGYPMRNRVNLMFMSNEDQPLPLDNDDRRHLVIYTPPPKEEAFYDDLYAQIERGGIEAFYHYLLNYDIGSFHPKKRPPMTEAKKNLIRLSMTSERKFMHEWLSGDIGLPVCPCLGSHLYIAYCKFCDQEGERFRRNRTQFLAMLGKGEFSDWRSGESVPTRKTLSPGSENKNRRMVIPPAHVLEEASKRISPGERVYTHNPAIPQAEWLAEGFFAFMNAIGVEE